jgi:hypothetical protein
MSLRRRIAELFEPGAWSTQSWSGTEEQRQAAKKWALLKADDVEAEYRKAGWKPPEGEST